MKSALNKVFEEILAVQHEDYQHYLETGEIRHYTLEGFEKRMEEYRKNKRQNRTTMAKKEQPRDAHGHFASKDAAKKKQSIKKAIEKTYRDAFLEDEKIIKEHENELRKLCEDNARLNEKLREVSEENEAMDQEIDNLQEAISKSRSDAKYWEVKAKRYFNTIEAQNDLIREIDSVQLTWYRNHASLWTRLRHFKHIIKMMNVVCTLRQNVLNTMYKW